jgi:hypothetical protein
VGDVPGLAAEPFPKQPEQVDGYEILGHRLEYVGICPTCRTTSGAPPEAPVGDAENSSAGPA